MVKGEKLFIMANRNIFKYQIPKNNMQNKIVVMFLFLFLFSLVAGQMESLDSVKVGDCITWKQTYSNATYTNFSDVKVPNGTTIIFSPELNSTKSGISFYRQECNYTSQIGTYHLCGHTDVDGIDTNWCYSYEVTAYGNLESDATATIYSLLLLFFVGLIVGLVFLHRKINFEQWNNKIYQKYENKNYVKLVLSSITYNLMKNTFILYYLLGLPIILIVTDIAYVFNMTNIHTVLENFIIVYSVGLIAVGIIFFSHAQEWFMDLLNKVRDMDWGIE